MPGGTHVLRSHTYRTTQKQCKTQPCSSCHLSVFPHGIVSSDASHVCHRLHTMNLNLNLVLVL